MDAPSRDEHCGGVARHHASGAGVVSTHKGTRNEDYVCQNLYCGFFRVIQLVKVDTDEGFYGWEATVEFNDEAVAAAIHTASAFLIEDPFRLAA